LDWFKWGSSIPFLWPKNIAIRVKDFVSKERKTLYRSNCGKIAIKKGWRTSQTKLCFVVDDEKGASKKPWCLTKA